MLVIKELIIVLFYLKIANSLSNNSNSWKSLNDCLNHFPSFEYDPIEPSFDSIPALKHEFPHAAALGWILPENNNIRWSCGGSLISEDTILTAAHCTFDHRRQEPSVVRLGDLNLETDDDEYETQQFEIQSIIRHPAFKTRYNDIALIKLKKKVNVTEFVVPACLWNEHELPYNVGLEACGYGQTEYLGDISPVLNKIIVSNIDINDCQKFYEDDRKLKDGLLDDVHLCADDKIGLMDTCDGDSGGPLEMKLEYGYSLVPFIVGVTAFGNGCGFDHPGVYTRVSTYIDWIKKHVPEVEINQKACSELYKEFRATNYTYIFGGFESQKEIIGQNEEEKALASIITDRFLLGMASDMKRLSKPNEVHLSSSFSPILIEKIFVHPKFIDGELSNNVALIKLKTPIQWYQHDYPTCLSDGQENIEEAVLYQQELSIDYGNKRHQIVQVTSMEDCVRGIKQRKDLKNFSEDLFCVKNDNYHVPKSCNVALGSPIFMKEFSNFRQQTLVKGLVLSTQDCTFTLVLNVSNHYEWINSIVFPDFS